MHKVSLPLDSPAASGRILNSIPEVQSCVWERWQAGDQGSQIVWVARRACRRRRNHWERSGGGRSRARRAYSAPRTPRQGGADTDECRPRSAPRTSWSTEKGWADICADVHVPPPQSANRGHRTAMWSMGCARVLATRHDALATRLGRAKLTRPPAVRCPHSARTRTWVGRGGGLLAPSESANRETLPSHRGGAGRTLMLPAHSDEVGRTRRDAVCSALEHETRSLHAVGERDGCVQIPPA